MAQRWPSDNADITVHHVHGWLIAMTESFYIHLLDPFSLETKHTLDIRDSPNLPEGTSLVFSGPGSQYFSVYRQWRDSDSQWHKIIFENVPALDIQDYFKISKYRGPYSITKMMLFWCRGTFLEIFVPKMNVRIIKNMQPIKK